MQNITGKPGVVSTYVAQARDVFYGNRQDVRFIPGPVTIDGTLSDNPPNAPYDWLLFAGTLMGRVTASGKFANSILGLTGAATASGATTISTDVNTAKELVRRIGTSGTFTLTGPPTSGGTVASQTITYSAVNTTSGAITCTATTAAAVSASLIGPTDGSQTIVTFVCDLYGVKVIDTLNSNRIDVYDPNLYAGGGIIDTSYLVNYPSDVSLKAYIKAAIRANIPVAMFKDDLVNT